MNIVNGLRHWSVLIVAGMLVFAVPLTPAEAAHGGGGGGGHGGFGGGGRGGFSGGRSFGHGGFAHGFRGHGFHGGFRGSVVIGLGGWGWDPWWYGPYWPGPYSWGAPGYYGYGYPGYPYEGYDPGYAYPPAAPPVGYGYGVETFQAPFETPPPQAPPPTSQAPPPVTSQVPPAYAPVTASLQIEVTPVEAEILVDGMRVGRAKEIKGPISVPVAAGAHTVGFRLGGMTTIENIMVSPQTTVLIKRNLGSAGAPQP
ncbi:MAG: PEGA domain-containing protein [candidate division NC10 bacterium]|nr:PEGA domain-containing protein [candidate division NC10 bacterium]MDE2322164.1 PEGA domain-containing protein [candidate division NC10 bacterium]